MTTTTVALTKRPAGDDVDDGGRSSTALSKRHKPDQQGLQITEPSRTSTLPAPNMLLSGHGAAVHVNRFNGDGSVLASGSFDKQIFLWRTVGDNDACDNFLCLSGHQAAVLDLCWSSDSQRIYSVGADKLVVVWDAEVGAHVRKLRAHSSFVNACAASRTQADVFASAGDDRAALLWDLRARGPQARVQSAFPITAVALGKDDRHMFVGGIDPDVRQFDLRTLQQSMVLEGAQDTITGVALSGDGAYLLTNAMDNVVRCFDVRPFCPEARLVKTFLGASHDFEKNLLRCAWSADDAKVAAGSADRFVHVWDVATTRIQYKLPGHKGSVNDVAFHPSQPVIASASSDGTVYLGELN
ncbi:WD domain, G-beta repeat [Plasmodiophora brassicae]